MADAKIEMKGEVKLYWVVTYKYANPQGQMRNGQLLLAAPNAEVAKTAAKDKLSQHDWFKIGAITPA